MNPNPVLRLGLVVVLLGALLAESRPVAAAELAPATGRLLVARPELPDPRFRRSVILLVQHNEEGSGGLIINRPSRLSLAEVLDPDLTDAAKLGRLHYGGPVAPRSLLVLLDQRAGLPASRPILKGVVLTGLAEFVRWLGEGRRNPAFRVFAGHAGWAPGQLEAEIRRGDWRVLPADRQTVFATDAEVLWDQLQAQVLL